MHETTSHDTDMPRRPAARHALWALGFRPFYLLGALFSSAGMLLWVLQFLPDTGNIPSIPMAGGMPAMLWHAHEMVFGFTFAIIAGFLLTAVRAWTGQPTPSGWPLAALAALWLAGRVLAAGPFPVLTAVVVTAFPLAVAWAISGALWRSGNRRNFFFIGLLTALAAATGGFHLALAGHLPISPLDGVHIALDVVLFIIAVIGGRVIPMFTNNGVPGTRATRRAWVERAALGLLLALLAAHVLALPDSMQATLALAAAAAHAVRLHGWQPWRTLRTPLVWILHAGYAWLVVHLLLRGLAHLHVASPVLATHALTAGAIGAMTVGMMTRTARGQTGRPLRADRWEVTAYLLILCAALVRVAGGAWPAAYGIAIQVSGLMWIAGFGVYASRYWPVLSRPRLDGKPG
ncbi:MAG TPA: NnrS family protein [Burkholderiaceae bacterium]|nr:NnrS family protein [Burkholderiaceae bacterium]